MGAMLLHAAHPVALEGRKEARLGAHRDSKASWRRLSFGS
jgi:hypothetical protein